MNTRKSLLLLGVSLVSLLGLQAQNNDTRYLDDAYYSRKDIKKIDEEQRRKAALREAAYRAEREAWEKKQAELIASYKKKQADRELDAYNGHLALPEDTIALTRAELGRLLSEQRSEQGVRVWGPYSSRLQRFYGDGSTIIDGARRVYIDSDPWSDLDYRVSGGDVYVSVGTRPLWGSTRWDWGWGSGWYRPYGWGYSSWSYPRWGGYWGGYDPYWDDFAWGYSSWSYPRWGGYWGSSWGGYWGGAARYNNYPTNYTPSYSRYRATHNHVTIQKGEPLDPNPATVRSYDHQTSHSRWNDYQHQPMRSYNPVPTRSYDRSATQSNGESHNSGGYRTPARRR